MGYRSIYVKFLRQKMLCNVRDVPVSSYTGYSMQTAKRAIVKYMCRAYTPKCYVICEMYLFHIQTTSYKQLMHAHMYMYICTSCK